MRVLENARAKKSRCGLVTVMRLAQAISPRSTSSKAPNSLTLERVESDFLIVAFDARRLIDKDVGSVDSFLLIRTPEPTEPMTEWPPPCVDFRRATNGTKHPA
jgi:hypothetical protein